MHYKHHYPEALEDLEKLLIKFETMGYSKYYREDLEEILMNCIRTNTRHITGTNVYQNVKQIIIKNKAWTGKLEIIEKELK